MNSKNETNCNCTAKVVYGIAILGAFLIVGFIVWAARHYTQPEALNANRAAERSQALAEIRAAEAKALSEVAWIDQGKGVVRLPINEAMELVQREWSQDPAAARAKLLERVEKATFVPPPPPAEPSQFE